VLLAGRQAWLVLLAQPAAARLPNRVAAFSGPPLVYAAGRIAYVSRNDGGGATLSVADLSGRSRHHASFQAPEQLESFAFDGTRLAFAHTRYRPDQGPADDGRPSICFGDRILVQETASVKEVVARVDHLDLVVSSLDRSLAFTRSACIT
jgi:hypothetical protein